MVLMQYARDIVDNNRTLKSVRNKAFVPDVSKMLKEPPSQTIQILIPIKQIERVMKKDDSKLFDEEPTMVSKHKLITKPEPLKLDQLLKHEQHTPE
jgi:hypothetical protein